MKYTMTATLFTAALFFASSISFAGEKWSNYTHVSEITATNKEYYIIQLHSPVGTKACKNKNTVYLDYDARGSKPMFQILLNSLIAKKEVRVHLTGRCEFHGYSEISSVSIRP